MPRANGAASARAQGHATINTDVKALTDKDGSKTAQTKADPKAIPITILVNRRL
ncbi:MAG: hypothetical protein HYY24_15605 [Verrucomicrobia bacterium]|nr:hypothetical protein [Verrucomicrobiota bacterium]